MLSPDRDHGQPERKGHGTDPPRLQKEDPEERFIQPSCDRLNFRSLVPGTQPTIDSPAKKGERKEQAVQVRNIFRGEAGSLQLLLELSPPVSTSGVNRHVVSATEGRPCWHSQQDEAVGAQHPRHFAERLVVIGDASMVNDVK
jgi:hypothetical protein